MEINSLDEYTDEIYTLMEMIVQLERQTLNT